MGGKSSAPAPPDYRGLAEEQAKSSREVTEQQTWANRPTQITPFGREDWYQTPVWDPATGQYLNKWTQTTNLNPLSQRALDGQLQQQASKSELATGMLDRLRSEYQDPMSWDGFENLQRAPDVPMYGAEDIQRGLNYDELGNIGGSGDYRSAAEQAIYEKGASRLDPRITEGREGLRTQLLNQGLSEGDEAYKRQMRDFEQNATDAYGQLNMDSIIGGGAEAQRDFGIDLSRRGQLAGELEKGGSFYNQASDQALRQQLGIGGQQFNQGMQQSGFQNTLRQQQLAEQMQQRGFTLNEINAIMSGQQVGMPSMPGFQQAGRSDATQYSQAGRDQYQGALDSASLNNAASQATMEGITGLAGAGMGAMKFSDRRLKRMIVKLGTHISGLPLYAFKYLWSDEAHVGFMADEVRELFPAP